MATAAGVWAKRAFLPVLLVYLLLMAFALLPFARATGWPPARTAFVGVFFSIPDVFNYFSYIQQAQQGAFLLENKLTLDPHRPAFVNLEWWAVGRLSGLTGLSVPVSFHVLGALATLALVLGMKTFLDRAGIAPGQRLTSLLLVFFGTGFGGVLFLLFGPPAWRFLDLTTGLFPVISVMVNAHFVTGTALLVWATLLLNRGGASVVFGLLLGNILGLSRPYDVVTLVGIQVLTALRLEPRSRLPGRLLPLLGLIPAVVVNYWTLYANPAFRMLSAYKYSVPPYLSLALALGPALVAAGLGLHAVSRGTETERLHRTSLLNWAIAVLASVAVLSLPFPFLFQSGVNVGLPLFALGALGLALRWPGAMAPIALLASTTGPVALKLLLEDNPSWFVPRERVEIARALDAHCRPGQVAMAPPEIGMYLNAYSSCRAFVTHVIAPDTAVRRAELEAFYLRGDAGARARILDERCVSHLVLPSEGAFAPPPGFRPVAQAGSGPLGFTAFARDRLPDSCRLPRPL